MRRLFSASFAYLLAGVLSGLFYREFTKLHDFPRGHLHTARASPARATSC